MKKFFAYIAMALFCVACSNNDITDEDRYVVCPEEGPGEVRPAGVYAILESEEMTGEENVARSSLAYSYTEKVMKFKWDDDNDKIGVYPVSSPTSCQVFEPIPGSYPEASLERSFVGPEGVRALTNKNSLYVAYKSKSELEYLPTSYSTMPLNYLNQIQRGTPNMEYYPYSAVKNTPDYIENKAPRYNESERLASAHLGAYDYSVTAPTYTDSEGSIYFKFRRISAIVRLMMIMPDPVVYDSLQVVNKQKKFVAKSTLNIGPDLFKGGSSLTIDNVYNSMSNKYEVNVLSLKLYDGETPGVDFSDNTDTRYYDSDGGNYIAYMMFPPTDLSSVESCTLYLHGHDKSTGDRKFYKATLKSKPVLTPNKFFQWVPNPEKDEPITFEAIEVQEWENATIHNTEGGNGTQTW